MIESGHFLFGAVGERVMHVDVRLFYKHRGLEAAAQGLPPADALAVLRRACAGCAVSNAVAVCGALEEARASCPTRTCAASGRCWWSLSACGTISTTPASCAPGWGWRREPCCSPR
ncbi:MAG: hypothetical protein U0Y82_08975 [Thermoleophilia bacterium]